MISTNPSGTDEDGCADDLLCTQWPDWVSEDELIGVGIAGELVTRLPVRHTGHDGRPCWPADEVNELLYLAAWEGR